MQRHPCGALPVWSIHASLHFCEHHMAWFAHLELTRQDDDEPTVLAVHACEFGPFDRRSDVARWLADWVDALDQLPGVPWAF